MSDSEETIFGWITKYRPSENRNPREDMLTQAFASVLDSVDDLAQDVFASLLDSELAQGSREDRGRLIAAHSTLRTGQLKSALESQKSILVDAGQRRRVDLEVCWSERNQNRAWIWCEDKWFGTQFQPGQIPDLARALEREASGGSYALFIITAQAGAAPEEQIGSLPDGFPLVEVTWQEVGLAMKAWNRSRSEWLVTEFVKHLRTEGLLNDQMLTEDNVKALELHEESVGRLNALLQEVDARIDPNHGDLETLAGRLMASGENRLEKYRFRNYLGERADSFAKEAGWPMGRGESDYFFEWRVGLNDPPSATAFKSWLGAGLTMRSELTNDLIGFPESIAPSEQLSLALDGEWSRLYAWRKLDSFQAENLQQQADEIAGWIKSTFNEIAEQAGDLFVS